MSLSAASFEFRWPSAVTGESTSIEHTSAPRFLCVSAKVHSFFRLSFSLGRLVPDRKTRPFLACDFIEAGVRMRPPRLPLAPAGAAKARFAPSYPHFPCRDTQSNDVMYVPSGSALRERCARAAVSAPLFCEFVAFRLQLNGIIAYAIRFSFAV